MGFSIKSVVPTVARALGGPLAGLAVDIVGKALGLEDATQKKIEDILRGPLTGDQIVALKQAEIQLELRLKELDIQLDQLEVQDRMNARDREVKAGGKTTSILAWMVMGAFVGMLFAVLFGWARVDSVLAGTIIGYASAKADQVLSYYFGSSRGSDDKTKIIDKMSQGNGK